MKKIYTVTLEGGDRLSGGFKDNLRIVAVEVYAHIKGLYGDGNTPLDIDKCIVPNGLRYLYDTSLNYYTRTNFRLDSDLNSNKKIRYEPFIVDPKTFGITIVDDDFGEEELRKIVEYILRLFVLRYRINIKCFPSVSENKEVKRCTGETNSSSPLFKNIHRQRRLLPSFRKKKTII